MPGKGKSGHTYQGTLPTDHVTRASASTSPPGFMLPPPGSATYQIHSEGSLTASGSAVSMPSSVNMFKRKSNDGTSMSSESGKRRKVGTLLDQFTLAINNLITVLAAVPPEVATVPLTSPTTTPAIPSLTVPTTTPATTPATAGAATLPTLATTFLPADDPSVRGRMFTRLAQSVYESKVGGDGWLSETDLVRIALIFRRDLSVAQMYGSLREPAARRFIKGLLRELDSEVADRAGLQD